MGKSLRKFQGKQAGSRAGKDFGRVGKHCCGQSYLRFFRGLEDLTFFGFVLTSRCEVKCLLSLRAILIRFKLL
jgi:hypothetical protein